RRTRTRRSRSCRSCPRSRRTSSRSSRRPSGRLNERRLDGAHQGAEAPALLAPGAGARVTAPEELRELIESYLDELALTPELGGLAGDALLAEALRLALTYPTPAVARELVQATLGMIGGQYLDIAGGAPDLASLHRLKTGCLFSASVACALWAAEVPEREQGP